ncbi:MAG: murein biosynthesis integral membrane protein MurJ [Gammaproteobacteria bacterium]|nr:MAG: murein biosynthesis integral membrane protein MurJ [Gammaproteobacteria bacterium]
MPRPLSSPGDACRQPQLSEIILRAVPALENRPLSLFRSLSTVGVFTLASRILGFVRDLVLAHVFGANALTDAFFVAFKIPNFLRRLFAEGAFATAFVPVLTEYKTSGDPRRLGEFIDHVAGTLGLVLLVVSLLGVVAAPLVVGLFAFGWVMEGATERLNLAAEMLRLTFPYLFFISLTAFAGGIMNAWNRFAVPAFTPVLLNLSLIGCALWLAPLMEQPVVALAWGVLIAGVSQFAFQLPFLHRLELLPRPRPGFRDPGVRRILRLMVPALFAVSITQINLLLDTVLASTLVSGSISWLYYSDRLMEFPLGVLGVALGTVLLPRLSQEQAEKDASEFDRTLDWGLRIALIFGLPAAVGLGVLAGPIISTLFQSDVFTARDVIMARLSLMAYASGLLAFIFIKVLAPGYYARQDTRSPVRIGVIAMVANMALNLVLIFPLKHAGLALATSLAAYLNAWLLWRGLVKAGRYTARPGWRGLVAKVVLACSGMALVLHWGAGALSGWFEASHTERALRLGGWVLAGVTAYFGILFSSGVRPTLLRRSGGD